MHYQGQQNHAYGHHSSEHSESLLRNAEILLQIPNVQRFHIEEGHSPELDYVGTLELIYFSQTDLMVINHNDFTYGLE